MERSMITMLFVATVFVLGIKGLQAQDTSNVCDTKQECSCCAFEDACLSSHTDCHNCSTRFAHYFCLGPCNTYDCLYTGFCFLGYCQLPCKDGYWGARCIKKCPVNCISCNQMYKESYECFKCAEETYGRNCTKRCPVNCFNGICEKTTGACLSCKSGYYGDSCSDECPANCDNDACEKTTGVCLSCKSGYYGNSCSDECLANCDNGLCEKTTGACLSCKSGYYGDGCSDECPANCDNDACEKTTGVCLSCKPSYYGNSCSNECPANCDNDICNITTGTCFSCKNGYHGQNCSENCSKFCRQSCDKSSGYCESCTDGYHGNMCEMPCPSNCVTNSCFQNNETCSEGCKPNFIGDSCTSCKPGTYGEECSQTCSAGCKNDVCEKEQGSCNFGCKDGFSDSQYCCTNNTYCGICVTTSTCRMCTNSTYGNQCQLKCPVKCNGTCDMLTGKCTSCLVGYHGVKCDKGCNTLCRHSICDMEDGQCTYGCINNSTERGCVEEEIKRMPENGEEATAKKVFPTGTLVGAVVSSLAVLLILLSVFIVRRQCQNNNDGTMPTDKTVGDYIFQNNGQDILTELDADINHDSHNDADVAEMHETNGTVEPMIHLDDATRNVSPLTGVRLDKIQKLTSKPQEEYQNEFKMLPMGLTKPHNDACKPENMKKNRYNAIYPYDENRVKVVCGQFDYINASYINGFEKSRAYIAALGPTEKTIGDFAVFWKMVWQEKVEMIVMLTRLVESSGMKCDQYWPDNGTVLKYGDISIECECEDVYAEFTARQFTMNLKKERRHLHHIQFTAWPDKGVPDDIISIINLRQRICRIGCRFDGPVLVHCSAGIGRTGTYIALDILSKQGADENDVDVFKCVLNLRQQRVNMVQTLDQYKFLHYAVAWTFMVDIEQHLACSFKELSWVDRQLLDMFKMLQLDIFQETDEDTAAVESNRENTYANRENSDIPGYRHNVTLWPDGQATTEETGYINAVYIDGFRRRTRFIAAQTPLPGTVSDFLKMIVQCDPSCIIDLEPVAENQKDVGKYLPAANQSFQEGSFVFRVTGLEKRTSYTKRTLEVSSKTQSSSMTRTMDHLTFTKWPEWSTLPEDAMDIVNLIQDVETTSKNSENEGPILIHCLNGAIRSGLLCGVWLAIERLEHEQRVNVLNTLRQVKYRRRQTIVNKEQLKFCFECVSTYVNRFESHVYSNQ